jgi:hypothetical protein
VLQHTLTISIVGPALPKNTTPSSQTRYTKSQFELPRPQLINPTPSSVEVILGDNTIKSDTLWREALAPLAAPKQRQGFKIGFFEQGIITGGLITLASLIATVSTLGYYTWTYVRRV